MTKTVWEALCTAPAPGAFFDSCSKGPLLGSLTNNGRLTFPAGVDKLYIEDMSVPNDGLVIGYQNVFRQ